MVLAAPSGETALALIELGAVVLGMAVLARLASRWGITAIPFYLLAGLAVGEGGAILDVSEAFISRAADIGVLLLLLTLGLEYTPQELRSGLRTGIVRTDRRGIQLRPRSGRRAGARLGRPGGGTARRGVLGQLVGCRGEDRLRPRLAGEERRRPSSTCWSSRTSPWRCTCRWRPRSPPGRGGRRGHHRRRGARGGRRRARGGHPLGWRAQPDAERGQQRVAAPGGLRADPARRRPRRAGRCVGGDRGVPRGAGAVRPRAGAGGHADRAARDLFAATFFLFFSFQIVPALSRTPSRRRSSSRGSRAWPRWPPDGSPRAGRGGAKGPHASGHGVGGER